MAVDPLTHLALKTFLFILLVIFIAYVLSNALGYVAKKAQYYQYKKAEEYRLRVEHETEVVKNRQYLKNIGFDYKFGLLPGQSYSIMGVTFKYEQFDARSNTVYLSISCPNGKSQLLTFLYRGVESGADIGYNCDIGGTSVLLVGTMIMSPAVSVMESDKGAIKSEIAYLTFVLKVIEKPSYGEYRVLEATLKPGQDAMTTYGDYTITVHYYYSGVSKTTLFVDAEVKSKTGGDWRVTLYKAYTSKPEAFSEEFSTTVAKILYLPGGEMMIFNGEVSGTPSNTIHVNLAIGITKEN